MTAIFGPALSTKNWWDNSAKKFLNLLKLSSLFSFLNKVCNFLWDFLQNLYNINCLGMAGNSNQERLHTVTLLCRDVNTYFKQSTYINILWLHTYLLIAAFNSFKRHLSSSAPISEDRLQTLDDGTNINYCTTGKHKEAFSTLVKCLYKWHTFISRIFLYIGWVTVKTAYLSRNKKTVAFWWFFLFKFLCKIKK